MPMFTRQSCRLHYKDEGEGEPALIFLHGWCDSADIWRETIAEFSKERRCVAPDMRGHYDLRVVVEPPPRAAD